MGESAGSALTAVAIRRPRSRLLPVALLLTLLSLVGGFAVKAVVDAHGRGRAATYPTLGYSDVRALYDGRAIGRGTLYLDHDFEYPVVTGAFAEVADAARRTVGGADADAYFAVSAVLLAPFALAVTVLLVQTQGRRALLWVLSPALLAYAFLNWDLLAVLAAVAGLVLARRRADASAGVALGIGTAAKLFPALVAVPVVHARLVAGDRRGARRTVAGFLAAIVVTNVPVAVAAPRAWVHIWTFHSGRDPDKATIWFWAHRHGGVAYRHLVDAGGLVALAAVAVVLLAVAARATGAPRGAPVYPTERVAAGLVAAFLVVSKVHSPQYALWLVPLLVLAVVPLPIAVAYLVADALVCAAAFGWPTFADRPASDAVYAAATFLRAGVLAAVVAWAVSVRAAGQRSTAA